jgi:hypothetical protein
MHSSCRNLYAVFIPVLCSYRFTELQILVAKQGVGVLLSL